MCSRSHRLTDKCWCSANAAVETASLSKLPKTTGCRLPRDTAASTAAAEGRKKTSGAVQQYDRPYDRPDRPKSPTPSRGASTRRGTSSQRGSQQQQQNRAMAAEMLKRVAEKQLTGSSLAERMMADKLKTLPDNKSPGVQAEAKNTASD